MKIHHCNLVLNKNRFAYICMNLHTGSSKFGIITVISEIMHVGPVRNLGWWWYGVLVVRFFICVFVGLCLNVIFAGGVNNCKHYIACWVSNKDLFTDHIIKKEKKKIKKSLHC